MKNSKMLKTALAMAIAFICAFGGFAVMNVKADDSSFTSEYFLTENNWKNLPGYEYIAPNILDPGGDKYPAEVTFGEDISGSGINMKMRGYYQSLTGKEDGTGFAGIVLKEKVNVENFSITFTINKLGASSSASPADDGWVGIALVKKPNLFHSANTAINSGAVALLRTANRSVNLVMHEVGSGDGQNIANFSGSPTPPSANVDMAPATEGATLRYSIIVETSPTGEKSYYGKLEQLEFVDGQEIGANTKVIASKQTTLSLHHPDWYFEDGMAYLAVSASTDNFDKQWDITIKNISGVTVGKAADAEPISDKERAANIFKLINDLKIYTYFEVNGNMKESGESFYSPDSSIDVNEVATNFAIQLSGATADVLNELKKSDRASAQFADLDAYLAFLNGCKDKIFENYEDKYADKQVAAMREYLAALPKLADVVLANEKETYATLANVIDIYNRFTDLAIEKFTQAEFDKVLTEVITPYQEKLTELSIQKYLSLAEDLPAEFTMTTAKQAVFALVPAELIYEDIEDRVAEFEYEREELYADIMAAKDKFDAARVEINTLKTSNLRAIEGYENAAKVLNKIFYLANPAGAEHAEAAFAALVSYSDLSKEMQNEISAEDYAALIKACKESLTASIAALPEASGLTAENYINMGYDLSITAANNNYNMLDEVDGEAAATIEGKAKLKELVAKLSALVNPISAVIADAKTVKAGEIITLAYGDMFHNFYGRTYTVTASVGTCNDEEESYTVSFDKAGDHTVEITLADTVYGQSATYKLTVHVTGGGDETGGCGCGGELSATTCAGAGLVLVACLAAVMVTKRRKQCH